MKWVLGSEFAEDARDGEPSDAFPSEPSPYEPIKLVLFYSL